MDFPRIQLQWPPTGLMVFMILPPNVLSLSLRTPLVCPSDSELPFPSGMSMATLSALPRGTPQPVPRCHVPTHTLHQHPPAPTMTLLTPFLQWYWYKKDVFGSECQSTAFVYQQFPQTALSYHILRIAMQQHCNIRGYIPHGHNPNISLNHKWKYYRGKSHYVLDPQN